MTHAPHVAFRTACAAPWVSLHLDPRGVARACCENRLYELGRIPQESLASIWNGERLAALRSALRSHDLELGCEGCAASVASGRRDEARVGLYDHVHVGSDAPQHPVGLELELSNRCNLQCVMCNGELSSAIRTHREHRAPLPRVYDDRFFADLEELAPGLDHVSFLGGEPFLGSEPLRAFEVLARGGFEGRCHVTTNGTVRGPRVERLLDDLDVDVSISVDGTTAATVEAVRVGVDHRALLDGVDWFRERLARRGGRLALHFCVLRRNIHELRPFLRWADELDVDAIVLPVRHPMELSVDQLPSSELAELVDALERQAADEAPLGRNASSWDAELRRLRAATDASTAVRVAAPRARDPSDPPAADAIAGLRAWADARGVHRLEVDGDGMVVDATPDAGDVLGIDVRPLVGQHSKQLLPVLSDHFGALARAQQLDAAAGSEDRLLYFEGPTGTTVVRALLLARRGVGSGWWYLAANSTSTPVAPRLP